jgi:3-hydroxybutyryl-CoA dehydrogenase
MGERLGIAGGGAIALGLARLRPGAVVWVRSGAGAERARAALDGAGATVTTDLAALEDATVVVEAIAEDRAAKAALLRTVPLADGALLATTTSSLPVAGLARDAGRPDRFFGLHLFNPVPRMELVELCFPDEGATGSAPGRTRCATRSARPRSRCPTCPASSSTGCCSPTCSPRCACRRRPGCPQRPSTRA